VLEVSVSGFVEWRRAARAMLGVRVPPDRIVWKDARDVQTELFGGSDEAVPVGGGQRARVPRRFLEAAEAAACHRSDGRWALLYRVLFRIVNGEPNLLSIEVDDDVRTLMQMARAVGGDVHRMHSFVRFRKVADEGGEEFVAWYRPDHLIVERASPFFVSRFGAMRWAILTPDASAYWDMHELRFGPGVPQPQAPGEDQLEDLWRAYYASTFNPARVNPKLMRAEMPVRHWATLPEASIVSGLVAGAGSKVAGMIEARPVSAKDFIPFGAALPELRQAIAGCRGCPLHRCATQAVFGEGPRDARVVLVGEQPGDEEDLAGRPFVGPAGKLLDRACDSAGVDRSAVYVTNAVKHFKFLDRGGRRLHQTPRGPEIAACRPWLEAEIGQIRPDLIVCLGATAAQAVKGRAVRVLSERGRFFPHHWAREAFVTVHPSSVLRSQDPDRDFRLFVEDLKMIAKHGSVAPA
jgi:DNA polymerase